MWVLVLVKRVIFDKLLHVLTDKQHNCLLSFVQTGISTPPHLDMSHPIQVRCKASRLLLGEMTMSVTAYTRYVATQLRITNLVTLRERFSHSLECLSGHQPSIYDLRGCWWDGPPTPTSQALATEHLLYISALTTFLDAVLDKLDRSLWLDAGAGEVDAGFSVLWGMMYDACRCFDMFPYRWATGHLPSSSPFHLTVQRLLLFLKPIACPRNSSQAWVPPLILPATSYDMHIMVKTGWSCLNHMCRSSAAAEIVRSVATLPPTFVSDLCYMACQQLPNDPLPPRVAWFFFRTLSISVAAFVKAACQEGRMDAILPIRTPAVLEAAIRGFIDLQDAPESTLESNRFLLSVLFAGYENLDAAGNTTQVHLSHGSSSQDSTMLGMSPGNMTSEAMLLHTIGKSAPADQSGIERNCLLFTAVMSSWPGVGSPMERERAKVPSENIQSLMLIARQCSAFAGAGMKGLQGRRQLLLQPQQQQQMQQRTAAVGSLLAIPTLEDRAVMQRVQAVMELVHMCACDIELPGDLGAERGGANG